MPKDNYGLALSGVDPESSIEMQKLLRQQKIADAMAMQAAQPLQGQMVGNVYVAPSMTQGLAKLAQGFLAGRDQQAIEQGMTGLAGKQHQMIADEMAKVSGVVSGKPASDSGKFYPVGGNPDEQGGMGFQPAIEPGSRKQIMDALTQSRLPAFQQAGLKMLTEVQKPERVIVPAGGTVWEGGKAVYTAPFKPGKEQPQSNLARLIEERAALPKGSPQLKTYDNAIRKESEIAKQIVPPTLTGNLEKPMTAAQKMKFDNQISGDFKSTGQVMQSMNQIISAIGDITQSKGLSAREGYTGYIPAWAQGKEAMTAQNRIDTLKGKVTQMGKAMASMSGAIGPMAVQEWKIVADAVNALDPRAGNFKEQLDNVQAQANGAAARIKDWYDRKYSGDFEKYPQFKTESIPLYPTGGGGREVGGKVAPVSPPAGFTPL